MTSKTSFAILIVLSMTATASAQQRGQEGDLSNITRTDGRHPATVAPERNGVDRAVARVLDLRMKWPGLVPDWFGPGADQGSAVRNSPDGRWLSVEVALVKAAAEPLNIDFYTLLSHPSNRDGVRDLRLPTGATARFLVTEGGLQGGFS